MSEHTQGPWEIFEHPKRVEWEVRKSASGDPDDWWFIATIYDGAEGASAEANAHLIAAAPEMYAALRMALTAIVEDLEEIGYEEQDIADNEIVKACRDAIAKAEGKP